MRHLASFLAAALLISLAGCHATGQNVHHWHRIDQTSPDSRLEGVWENKNLGHLVSFSPDGVKVFHRLNDYCIRDDGAVPNYALYRFGADENVLLLHYFDYREQEELLQTPLVFHRVAALPAYCMDVGTNLTATPAEVFDVLWKLFDRHYAFFEERGVDWDAVREKYEPRARAVNENNALFDILAEMLETLGDSHVNLYLGDRSFNAGRSRLRLRSRLADVWRKSGSDLEEQMYISDWHRRVTESVYEIMNAGSLRSGAAGAIEWGTIGEATGYVRINRFRGFTADIAPRREQHAKLRDALREMSTDLGDTRRVIVDVALNGGGSDAAAITVASYFADRKREVIAYQVAGGPVERTTVSPADSTYTKPILLMTSEVTASAAESFVLMMRAFPHVTHVGNTTRGGLSSLLPKPLPNGFLVTISYQRVLDAQGKQYEGIGIAPERPMTLFPDKDLYGEFAAALKALAQE